MRFVVLLLAACLSVRLPARLFRDWCSEAMKALNLTSLDYNHGVPPRIDGAALLHVLRARAALMRRGPRVCWCSGRLLWPMLLSSKHSLTPALALFTPPAACCARPCCCVLAAAAAACSHLLRSLF